MLSTASSFVAYNLSYDNLYEPSYSRLSISICKFYPLVFIPSLVIHYLLTHGLVMSFSAFHTTITQQLNQDIDAAMAYFELPSPLAEACLYAVSGSGKRVRPLLVASSYQSLVPDAPLSDMCRRAMLAVELLHAYSLVHDDLPCMDDDALRRGQPTCHIVYGEAAALLAGDALQSLAFEVLTADLPFLAPADMTLAAELTRLFAPRARRMVAGQMLDLNGEHQQLTQDQLEAIHRDKTGALIEAAVLMGAACAHTHSTLDSTSILHSQSDSPSTHDALTYFAKQLGLAFQVQDDILDVTADTEQLGKPAGSDEKLDKSTYVKLLGVSAATRYAKSLFDDALAALTPLNLSPDAPLKQLADWLWTRKK